jgi:transglutaminase-like putative cysteine protease
MAHGVCQDHTHIFVAAARAMGYPRVMSAAT